MQSCFDFPARDCNEDRIVWLDLELCSLEDHSVLECAVILTTCNELREAARRNWVIQMTQKEIDTKVLGGAAAAFHASNSISNGLLQACLESRTTREVWQRELLTFLQSHCGRQRPRLAGFSVHVDREVLRTQAPEVYRFVSHRIIDISSLAARSYNGPQGNHRAMSDNEGAIAKLKWYLGWLEDRLIRSSSKSI